MLSNLVGQWRKSAKEHTRLAEMDGRSEAERDWYMARAEQAEDCAYELERELQSLAPSGWKPIETIPEDGDFSEVCQYDANGKHITRDPNQPLEPSP